MLKLGRYWLWKTVWSHFHMPVRPMLLHRMALASFRLFPKNLGNLQEIFGQMVYHPGRKLPVRLCIKHFCRWNLSPKECFDLQKDRQNSQNNELPSSLQWSFDGKSSRGGFPATCWMERSCVCCSVALKIGHDWTLFDRLWIKALALHEQNMILHHNICYPSQLTSCCLATYKYTLTSH